MISQYFTLIGLCLFCSPHVLSCSVNCLTAAAVVYLIVFKK